MTNREIDRAVAEKVMGMGNGKSYVIIPDYAGNPTVTSDTGDYMIEWNPSTDISAAWEVVEKMQESGWMSIICTAPEGHAAAFTRSHSLKGNEPYQKNAAKAICLAALKAVGGEL